MKKDKNAIEKIFVVAISYNFPLNTILKTLHVLFFYIVTTV